MLRFLRGVLAQGHIIAPSPMIPTILQAMKSEGKGYFGGVNSLR